MGGSVNVAIRTQDGNFQVKTLWTNSIPYYLQNIKVLTKDQDYLGNFFNDCNPDNITHLGPTGYGLIVIDSQIGYILDMQEYCGLDNISMFQIYRMIRKERALLDFLEYSEHPNPLEGTDYQYIQMEVDWILGLANNGVFDKFCWEEDQLITRTWAHPCQYHSIEQFYQDFYDHFRDVLVDQDGNPDHIRGVTSASIDWAKFGYTYIRWSSSNTQHQFEFLQKLRDLNFAIDIRDLTLWREHIHYTATYDMEDWQKQERTIIRQLYDRLPKDKLSIAKNNYIHVIRWLYSRNPLLPDFPANLLIKSKCSNESIIAVLEAFEKTRNDFI